MFGTSVGTSPIMQKYLAANANSVLGRYMNMGQQQANQSEPNMQAGITSFAMGGMVAPGGGAVRPGAPMPGGQPMAPPQMGASAPPPMEPAQIEQEAKNFVKQNPQVVQQIQAVLSAAMQSGELTPDELNQAVQMARTALANPASYPQIRQFAIQNGFGTEADLPQEMDKGLLFTLLVAGQSLSANPNTGAAQGNAMQGQAPSGALPSYKNGGPTGDKAHIAQVDPYEYVATKEALMYHGKKTYDKLEEQARAPKDANAGA